MSVNLSISHYELDLMPTEQQATTLEGIQAGDRIVTSRGGGGWAWERGGKAPRRDLVRGLVDKQWIVRPHVDGPLFDHQGGGRLTSRGQFALLRYHDTSTEV